MFFFGKRIPNNYSGKYIVEDYKENLKIKATETWIGGGENYFYNSIANDKLGNIYITGYTQTGTDSDAFLIKYNYSGDIQWCRKWGGSLNDYGQAVAVDSSGDIYITGYTFSYGSGPYSIFLLKYNSFGDLQWDEIWGGDQYDWANDIVFDDSGNIYITGNTWSYGAGTADVLLLKFDSSGNYQWNKTWGSIQGDSGHSLVFNSSGNLYITGMSYQSGSYDVILLNYNTTGDLQWAKTWGGSQKDQANQLIIDSTSNITIVGYTESFGAGAADIFLLNYDSSGNLQWDKTWGGVEDDGATNIISDGLGNMYIIGGTRSYEAKSPGDLLLLKCDSSGDVLWNRTYGEIIYDDGVNAVYDSENLYILGSYSNYTTYLLNCELCVSWQWKKPIIGIISSSDGIVISGGDDDDSKDDDEIYAGNLSLIVLAVSIGISGVVVIAIISLNVIRKRKKNVSDITAVKHIKRKYLKEKEMRNFKPLKKKNKGKRVRGVKNNLILTRGMDYVGGFIRYKVVIKNPRKTVVTSLEISLKITALHIRIVDIKPRVYKKDNHAQINTLQPGESLSIDFYLEPLICGKVEASVVASFVDAWGKTETLSREPLYFESKCPLIINAGEENIAKVKNIYESEKMIRSSRSFELEHDPKKLFNLSIEAIRKWAGKPVSEPIVTSEDPFKIFTYFYELNQNPNLELGRQEQIIIKIEIDEEKSIGNLLVSTETNQTTIGVLNHIWDLINTHIGKAYGFKFITHECNQCGALFKDINKYESKLICDYCGTEFEKKALKLK